MHRPTAKRRVASSAPMAAIVLKPPGGRDDRTRFGYALVLFMRVTAAIWIAQGLLQWSAVLTTGPDGLVLVGVDLKKDPQLLHAAYNDAQGVTAAFNKNVLRRMNDELGADIDLDAFHHYAFYEPNEGRIEMHLVSAKPQTIHVGNHEFPFHEGESLCTERSYKYDVAGATAVANAVGLRLVRQWLDDDQRFAVLLFHA